MINRNDKLREEAFDKLLTQYTAKDPTFNTEGWRSYFKSLASRESNFQATIPNRIGAYGYFLLMPANLKRSRDNKSNPGAQFEDVFDLTRANLNYLKNHMTPLDYAKALAMGIDIYGLAAGAHLGGAQGMLNFIRSGNNPQDYNGTKISHYARDFSQNPKIKTNALLGNWSVEGLAVRFEDVANGTSVLTGDTPLAPLLAVISNMNNALSDENAVVYLLPDTTEESLNVWRSRIPKDIVVEETQPTLDASKIQDNNKNTLLKETQFKSLVRYGVPKLTAQLVPVLYVEDPLTTVLNVWDTYNNIYDELFSRDTFKERERALGGPINTNNPILNFSYFKGLLPIVRYSYGGELDDSIIPSSNSVKPNLFYDGGDTMTSQFLDRVLADREANLLRNEELAALYNFSPLAISDILLGKDVNVYTPDVVVTGKAPSVGFYPYGYHTVDKFYLDNPSGLMEDVGSFVPFVGDGMEVSNIANDLRLDNYGLAGLGLSLLALPNIIEKPLKFLAKNGYKIAGRAANMIKDELTPLYYNYKYGKKATKDMYDDFLHGKSYPEIMGIGKLDIRPLGMKSLQELMRDVVDRNSEIYKLVGVPEETINKYRELAKNIMGNIRVGRYTDTQYKTAGRESQGGFYAKSTDPFFISINRYSRIPTSKSILHETRHALDYLLDRTSQYSPTAYGARKLDRAKSIQESLLTNAYDLDFIDLPTTKYADSLAGYPLMEGEKITTNLDSRNELLKLLTNTGSLDINNLRAVNLAIDAASDDEVFWAVSKSNGYGSRYIKFLKDNNKLTPEKAQQFRLAMKYVGASTAPVGIWATTATSLDNKQHAFGGFLNKFSGEEDNYTQLMNTPNIFRKKDGTYVYLSSPQSDEISVEPINTVFENPSLWTYRDLQGRLYTPRESAFNQGTITLDNNEGPIISAVNNYLRELLYKWDNNIPIDGKYTMPAIAASALLPLAGTAFANTTLAGIPATTWADAALTAGFGAHGLNHATNEGIDGWGDAVTTAMEIAPLGGLVKPMWNVGRESYSVGNRYFKGLFNKTKKAYKRFTEEPPATYSFNSEYNMAMNKIYTPLAHEKADYLVYISKKEKDAFRKMYARQFKYSPASEVDTFDYSVFNYTDEEIERLKALFKHNPEYFVHVKDTGISNPLSQDAVDGFINRQLTSMRGVTAPNKETAIPYLTTTKRDRYMRGGDRLSTNGGLYTTNNPVVSDRFKNPIGEINNNGYVGILKEPDTINRTLSIEDLLRQLRNRTEFGDDLLEGTPYIHNLDRSNAKMFEASYVGRASRGTGGYERVYLPTDKYGEVTSPVQLQSLEEYLNQADQHGRWGYNLDVEINPDLFIAKQLNGYDDYIRRARAVLKPRKETDWDVFNVEYNRLYEPAAQRLQRRRDLTNKAYDKHRTYIEMKSQAPWILGMSSPVVGLFGYASYLRDENARIVELVKKYTENGMLRYGEDGEPTYVLTDKGKINTPSDLSQLVEDFKERHQGWLERNQSRNQEKKLEYSLGGPLNKFEEGGNTDDTKYQAFLEDLKNHAPNLAAPSRDYNMRRYWELRGKPSNWAETLRDFNYLYNVKEDPMFTLEDDGFYHAPSAALNLNTGIIEFMKSADHPTVKYELNWYDNGDETGPNGLRIPSFEGFKSSLDFKQNYELKYSPIENKYYYIPKQR